MFSCLKCRTRDILCLRSQRDKENKKRTQTAMEDETKSEKKEAAAEDEPDPRLDFMFNYLQRSVRLKPDKWSKLLGNKESSVSNYL